MKLLLALAGLAVAAPIIDLSGTPPKDMVTKRQDAFGQNPSFGQDPSQVGGTSANLGPLLNGLGQANGQAGAVGGNLLGNPNVGNVPVVSDPSGGTPLGDPTAASFGQSGVNEPLGLLTAPVTGAGAGAALLGGPGAAPSNGGNFNDGSSNFGNFKKRQLLPINGLAPPGSGPTGNLNNILQGIALGGPNGQLNQGGGIGSILSGGNANLANLPDSFAANGGLNTALNGGITNSQLPPQAIGQVPNGVPGTGIPQGQQIPEQQQPNQLGNGNINGNVPNGGFSNGFGGLNGGFGGFGTQGISGQGITDGILPKA